MDLTKSMPLAWQQFLLSVLFLVVVPLSAIVADLAIKGEVADQDLYLTLAVYFVATGATSRSQLILGVSIILSAAYFVSYGVVVARPLACPPIAPGHSLVADAVIYGFPLIFTAFSAIERYKRHVMKAEKFWDFG
jgi:hypothetical protein